jgi:hypothetical protein
MMNRKTPLIIAGIIFTIVSVLHLLRIVYHIEVMFGGSILPMWISYIGFPITLLLAMWMFKASRD